MSEQFKMTPEEWLDASARYGEWFKRHLRNHGSRICAYRKATDDDEFLYTNSDVPAKKGNATSVPVFILRPRKKVTVTDYIFKAVGETRVPQAGEWYKSCAFGETQNVFTLAHFNNLYTVPKEIYTREEITREIEVDE